MKTPRLHFGLLLLLAGVIVVAAGPSGRADPVVWGLLPATSGSGIYDWEVQSWIDEFFDDGSVGDEEVNSNIVTFFTQCYGGDWMENFNNNKNDPEGGYPYDLVRFTQTSAYAANLPGLGSKYYGYHDDAAAALQPSNSSLDAHDAGVAGKHPAETPMAQGPDQPLTGEESTYVVVYAGWPEQADPLDIENIHNAYDGQPNTTVTVLAEYGGVPYADAAATKDNLRSTLQSIGPSMASSTFIFFVTDHGGLTHTEADPPPVLPMMTTEMMTTDWDELIPEPSPHPPDPSDLFLIHVALEAPIPIPGDIALKLTAEETEPFVIRLDDPSVIKDTLRVPSEQKGYRTLTRYTCAVPGEFAKQVGGKATLSVRNDGKDPLQLAMASIELTGAARGPELIPGDANLDGTVTDADAAILATHWQVSQGAAWTDGDFNGDGKVTDKDAAILATHWQEGVNEAAAPVPEPTPLVLLCGSLLWLMFRPARRTS